MTKAILKTKLANLPSASGCYLMKNIDNEIIYVGKAKDLNKRVSSYFKKVHNLKTQKMVGEIVDFDIFITNSEKEALILELNLIKLYNPRYNVLLKDDKTYPYIELTKARHPMLKISRNTNNKTSQYYGPYPDSHAAYSIINLLNQLFPLRKCRTLPSKPCLYYYLGQCLAPCINEVSEQEYKTIIQNINAFMKGDTQEVVNDLRGKMHNFSDKLEYEQANEMKKLIENIEYLSKGQSVQVVSNKDFDVAAYHSNNEYISITILILRNGKLLTQINEILPLYGLEEEVFLSYLMQYYSKNKLPNTLVLPKVIASKPLAESLNVKIVSPTRGQNFDLVTMAAKNALKAMEDNKYKMLVTSNDKNEVLDKLSEFLSIPYPKQIDFIDNSHLFGSDFVSAVVVFINGSSNKKMYRRYKIKHNETGADDKAVYEVIYRRYYRHLSENIPFCDLLLIDGGIIQVNAAKNALEKLHIDIPIFGVVKDDKHQTKGIIDLANNFYDLKEDKQLMNFISKLQAEIHRYVISFHKNIRSKSLFSSIIDDIEGIGPKRKQILLKIYGTINKIKETSVEELSQHIPLNVAKNLKRILEEHDL